MSKAKKAQEMLEAAMKKAGEDAQKLFKHHEKERKVAEALDKIERDGQIFDKTLEQERLANERQEYTKVKEGLMEQQALVLAEHRKLQRWQHVVDASWLPSVFSESEINTFLSAWRYEQQQDEFPVGETTVLLQSSAIISGSKMHLLRGDTRATPKVRQTRIDRDMELVVQAKRLTDEIWLEHDAAITCGDKKKQEFHRQSLKAVYEQILRTLDVVTISALQFYDMVLEHPEEETLLKQLPRDNPTIKYGLWIKIKEATRSFTALRFPEIGISLDPKDSSVHKLPKALNLSKENVSMRAMQLTFDPYSVWVDEQVGQEFYALDCLLVVEALTFTDRPKRNGEWLYRAETAETHKLHVQEYPPRTTEGKSEDPSLRITFDVPENVVLRHKSMLIGKWNSQQRRWDPCGHCNFSMDSVGRKTSFVTSDLTSMAIIQEKGFDVPFEQWQLFPLADDQVLFVLEGRRRGESSDREIKILVCDHQCKLLFPEEKELAYLRETWLPPMTLLRLLARAGYNFLLNDSDAQFTTGIQPKTADLEAKGYQDIANFCTRFAFASTRHNKLGENRNMTLFRISRDIRSLGSDEPFLRDVDDDSKWHSVRYERDRCVLANFKDSDDDPDLSSVPKKVTHLNLHTLLQSEYGEATARDVTNNSNRLLQKAVLELLAATRPFTWG
jgi:cancer susceptibility candidate protein 1